MIVSFHFIIFEFINLRIWLFNLIIIKTKENNIKYLLYRDDSEIHLLLKELNHKEIYWLVT